MFSVSEMSCIFDLHTQAEAQIRTPEGSPCHKFTRSQPHEAPIRARSLPAGAEEGQGSMLKHLATALAAAEALTTAAAAEVPASQEDCLKGALALAEKAEGKADLSESAAARVEELLSTLEAHCDAGRFADAAAASGEIEAALAGK